MKTPEERRDFGSGGAWAYRIFFFLGLGNLFPWNTFITASYYFADRFCGTSFESNFENYFAITFTACQTIGDYTNVYIPTLSIISLIRISCHHQGLALTILYCEFWSLDSKVTYPLIVYSLIFLITTIMVDVFIDANIFFDLTLTLTALSGLCGSLLSAGIFGMAAYFPFEYTGALMSGQGVAGLAVSLSSLLTSMASSSIDICDDDDGSTEDDSSCENHLSYSALAYFSIATAVLICCIISFQTLKRLSITRYYLGKGDLDDDHSFNAISTTAELPKQLSVGLLDNEIMGGGQSWKSEIPDTDGSITAIFRLIWIPAVSVFLGFTVTIGIFPAAFVQLQSEYQCHANSNRFYNDLFVPFLFVVFNLFDLTGRVCAEKFQPLLNKKNILQFALLRFLFIPLILLCNVSDSQLPVVFLNDSFPIIFEILFALTNGYLAAAAMMIGPTLVSSKDSGTAGTIMIFCLTLGLMGGSGLSFLVMYISQG